MKGDLHPGRQPSTVSLSFGERTLGRDFIQFLRKPLEGLSPLFPTVGNELISTPSTGFSPCSVSLWPLPLLLLPRIS